MNTARTRSHELAEAYPLFDWLRFFLAAVVALYHSDLITWHWTGSLSVSVFFSLSGWLIGGILLEMKPSHLPRFYFNRVTRIWLPYAAAIVLLYGTAAVLEPFKARWLEFLFYDVTFTHNWFTGFPDALAAIAQMPLHGSGVPFWSISVEEQFYLVAPVLILFVGVGRSPLFWAPLAALLCVFEPNFAAIALGVVAATLTRRFPGWHLKPAPFAGTCLLFLAAAAAMAKNLVSAAPFFSIAVVLLVARPGARGALGTFLGGISYPLYLNQWLGRYVGHSVMKRLGFNGLVVNGIASCLAAILIAIIAYLLVDRRVLAKRNGLYSRSLGVASGLVAYSLILLGLLVGLVLIAVRHQHLAF